jgi:hypothetical protein
MIVAKRPNRKDARWPKGIILTCAVLIPPLGLASPQDYEAVGRRLRAAVQAGELTREQARIMLDVLRRADDGEREPQTRARAHLMEVRQDLGAADPRGGRSGPTDTRGGP